jgi:hypothetical protein
MDRAAVIAPARSVCSRERTFVQASRTFWLSEFSRDHVKALVGCALTPKILAVLEPENRLGDGKTILSFLLMDANPCTGRATRQEPSSLPPFLVSWEAGSASRACGTSMIRSKGDPSSCLRILMNNCRETLLKGISVGPYGAFKDLLRPTLESKHASICTENLRSRYWMDFRKVSTRCTGRGCCLFSAYRPRKQYQRR